MEPHHYWAETPADRDARVRQQTEDRRNAVNDYMELIYTDDLDEVFAGMVRLHAIVGDHRTKELLDRVFADRAPS